MLVRGSTRGRPRKNGWWSKSRPAARPRFPLPPSSCPSAPASPVPTPRVRRTAPPRWRPTARLSRSLTLTGRSPCRARRARRAGRRRGGATIIPCACSRVWRHRRPACVRCEHTPSFVRDERVVARCATRRRRSRRCWPSCRSCARCGHARTAQRAAWQRARQQLQHAQRPGRPSALRHALRCSDAAARCARLRRHSTARWASWAARTW